MNFPTNTQNRLADLEKVIDDALEKLRWCRQNHQDPRASVALRELEAKLGYLAQALIWQDEGDLDRAHQALGLALGVSLAEQDAARRMWEDMLWSH
jgi:hypothetical protein